MSGELLISAGIALVAIGYLAIEFGRLVLDEKTIERETGEDAAYDAETAAWINSLRDQAEVQR